MALPTAMARMVCIGDERSSTSLASSGARSMSPLEGSNFNNIGLLLIKLMSKHHSSRMRLQHQVHSLDSHYIAKFPSFASSFAVIAFLTIQDLPPSPHDTA